MTTIFVHSDLLKQYPDPAQPTIENTMYSEFITTSQLFGPFISANTSSIRDQFQSALKNSGGRVPPQDQRAYMRVMPTESVSEITDSTLVAIIGLYDTFGLVSEVLRMQRYLKLSVAQWVEQVPSFVPNWEILDEDGNGTGVGKSWWDGTDPSQSWSDSDTRWFLGTDNNYYLLSNAGTTNNEWLAGSQLLALQQGGHILNAKTVSDAEQFRPVEET
jgi:hypothetical protein